MIASLFLLPIILQDDHLEHAVANADIVSCFLYITPVLKMLVFRSDRPVVSAVAVIQDLAGRIKALSDGGPHLDQQPTLEVLIRAGMLESALADQGLPQMELAKLLTDNMAEIFVNPSLGSSRTTASDLLSRIRMRGTLPVDTPEGFAYYALHPMQFARLADTLSLRPRSAAVIGIRSIGTTLSAIVTASLRNRQIDADRITIRPEGHPYDRKTIFTRVQLAWIAQHRCCSSKFLIVDEGPGLSGSSLLSVADALLSAGVERRHIQLLHSASVNPAGLRARDGANRWTSFNSSGVPPDTPSDDSELIELSGGLWRTFFFRGKSHWPSSWPQMERRKFLLRGCHLLKFEGCGPAGEEALQRAELLSKKGFGPSLTPVGNGYVRYQLWAGRCGTTQDLSESLLNHIARYCSFRYSELRASGKVQSDLERMTIVNFQEEFGDAGRGHVSIPPAQVPVVADGRMLPHEWVLTGCGWLKADGASHGNDHFYPGPTDISWDLAGAIVEWKMGPQSSDYFVRRYQQMTGDNIDNRLPAYLIAYVAFRMGFCKMASESVSDSAEKSRLQRDYHYYRSVAESLVPRAAKAS